jgi:hypothetical protein
MEQEEQKGEETSPKLKTPEMIQPATLKLKQISENLSPEESEEQRKRIESYRILDNHVAAVSCAHCQNVMGIQDFAAHQDECIMENPHAINNLNRHNSSGSPFTGKHSRNKAFKKMISEGAESNFD